MKRLVLLLCAVLIVLTSCGERETDALSCLEEMMACCGELPTGQIYARSAEEGMASYLNDTLRQTLYGEGAKEVFSRLSDFAIYLSFRPAPFEIAVFRCYSHTDAHLVAAMCMERKELLCMALRGTSFEERTEWIGVSVKDRTVIMTVIPDLTRQEIRDLIGWL